MWTGSPDVAEDVAQRVLLRVHGALGSRDDRGSTHAWAYRITRNQLIDYQRDVERERSLHAELELDRLVQASSPDGSISLDAVQLLTVLMRDLSPQQRAAVDLVDLQGFSGVEAADMLGVEPSTLRVHLHRARAALKAGYEEILRLGETDR